MLPEVAEVLDDMPRTVELVLEAVLAVSDVGRLADIAPCEFEVRPLHVHISPRQVVTQPSAVGPPQP